MGQTRELSGESTARGRNGWFKVASAHRFDDEIGTVLSLSSKRTADVPPVVLNLTRSDAEQFRQMLS